jgi:hypothetical protein
MWFERNNSPGSYNKYFHFLMERRKDSLKHNLLKRIEKLLRPLTKKEIHFFIYKGSTWFGATRECVNYILAVHKAYIKDFKHSRFPEESFFCTIVGNSKFIRNVTMDLTWSHFKNNQCQITTEKEIKIFKTVNIYLQENLQTNLLR